MRHIVHIMLGSNAQKLLEDLKRYIIKYGSEEENAYFTAMLYQESSDSSTFQVAQTGEADPSSFVSGIDDMFNISMDTFYEVPQKNRTEYLKDGLSKLYNQRITINTPGDSNSLHLTLYVPVYEPRYWAVAKEMLDAMEAVPQEFTVDLILLPYDLAFLFEPDTETLPLKMVQYQQLTKQTVSEILKAKTTCHSLEHLVMMQNCNSQGLSLDIDNDSFVRIVGEYALLSISHYQDIFPLNVQDDKRPINALGLSVLSFDKYYFVQYLLHQAYIHILDREQVQQKEVDVNKVSKIVQTILAKRVNVFSDFYDKYVKTRLEKHVDQDTIMIEVKPEWEAELKSLSDEFQSYIDDPTLTLPEKKATLAQLLGEDDELLSGYMFNRQQLVIDDCSRDVLDYFVIQNNALFRMREEDNSGLLSGENERKKEVNLIADHACLSDTSGEQQTMPSEIIDNLKRVRLLMRESSNYIRLKSAELRAIGEQEEERQESNKRLTDKGFVFDGNVYQLQDNNIVERPCEDDYIPLSTSIPSKVDLRRYFTPVKNQGPLGSCSSFTMVAIYEYILKKNKALESDLSEAFVYHYAHKRESNQADEGTSLYNNILAIQTEGVCLEQYCPYEADPSAPEPSSEAKTDALTRKIRKALNVRKDINHLRSALAEGYPVAVSLRVFDSFEPVAGFIPRPSFDEIKEDRSGNHAMVLCGYSDDEKVFIVRNSWGPNFGDKGYCYIPYSYIEDFMNLACIVTEINNEDIHVAGNDIKATISFDLGNSRIKAAILRNLIEEERHRLGALSAELQQYEFQYNILFQKLGNNTTRTTLCDGTLLRLEYEKKQQAEEKSEYETERIEELRKFDKITVKIRVYYALSWLLVIAGYALAIGPLHYDPMSVLLNNISYIIYGVLGLGVVWFIYKNWRRRRERRDLDEDYQSEIENCERRIQELTRQLEITKLKTHVAGMIIDSLAKLFRNLHSKYNGMHSYVGNLSVWRDEEAADSQMSDQVKEPFLTLISNSCLEHYFLTCKDQITEQIRLYEMFRHSYQVEEKEIIRFKNELKNKLVQELFLRLEGFSVYKQISGTEYYPYATNTSVDINALLRQMDAKSQYFLRTLPTIDHAAAQNACCKLLFVDADVEATRQQWKNICQNNFQLPPTCCSSDSHFKLTLIQMVGLAPSEVAILK